MKEYIIEQAERQNWTTKFKVYESGMGAIENIAEKTNKVTRVFLNQTTTQKFHDHMFKKTKVTITPSNRITRFLVYIGIVKIDVTYGHEDVEDK